jgi:hypothetical protein
MVNGKPGDDAILDVTVHGLPVYSDTIDALIRELWPACGTRERDELRAILPNPEGLEATELEQMHLGLEELRSRVLSEPRERGWEGPPASE